MNPKNIIKKSLYPLLLMASMFFLFWGNTDTNTKILVYSDLIKEIDEAKIKKIVIYSNGVVMGEFKTPQDNKTHLKSNIGEGDSAFLSRKLESQNPSPEIRKETVAPSLFTQGLFSLLPILFLVGFLIFFMNVMQRSNNNAMSFSKSKAKLLSSSQKKVTFKDVAGVDEAKDELREIVEFLMEPQKFQKLGGRIPKGILLIGPPGTGKTLLARTIAGEANVPFFSISGSDFVEMFVGVGASRVRNLFEQGKKNGPCIVFIDEIDAVGRHRGAGLGNGHDEREQTLNQLLVEMDGFDSNEGVILVAATNRPDILDPALLRPGRFDRQVVISKPDIRGRHEIFKIHSAKIPIDTDVDLEILARGTPGFTGADISNLCNEATLNASRNSKELVTMNDFEFARDKVLMGRERSIIISPKEKHITAVHEAGHAIVASMVPEADPIHKVTIIPRGLSMGSTWQLPETDRHNYSRTYLKSQLAILMAGRCAEKLIFEECSTGASNDIEKATEISREMICSWGMSEKLGPLKFGLQNNNPFLGKQLTGSTSDYSQTTAQQVDEEMKALIVEAQKTATKILRDRKSVLNATAQILIEKETITGEEVKKMLS